MLSEEEKKQILSSIEFSNFVNKATILIEKALSLDKMVDIMQDYAGTERLDPEE